MDNELRGTRTNQTVTRVVLDRAAMALVRYYAALRLSAGAATELLPVDLRLERPPIVRSSRNALPSGFDRREIVVWSGRPLVITIDGALAERRETSTFSPN